MNTSVNPVHIRIIHWRPVQNYPFLHAHFSESLPPPFNEVTSFKRLWTGNIVNSRNILENDDK
jgi:hypothetical protein